MSNVTVVSIDNGNCSANENSLVSCTNSSAQNSKHTVYLLWSLFSFAENKRYGENFEEILVVNGYRHINWLR